MEFDLIFNDMDWIQTSDLELKGLLFVAHSPSKQDDIKKRVSKNVFIPGSVYPLVHHMRLC